jgi:hypothetical protein
VSFFCCNFALEIEQNNGIMEMPSVHIGNMVRAELERQGKSVVWLAEQLNMQRPNCYRLLRAQSIPTDQLRQLSIILEHDFFADCVSLEIAGKEPISATTGVEFMQEFERKILHTRMELIEQNDEEEYKKYRFFYEQGIVECYASTGTRYIEICAHRVDELPYTPELYAASLHICNELHREDALNRYVAYHDEEKGLIYFDIKYDSIELNSLRDLQKHILYLFNCMHVVQKKVAALREQIKENSSLSLDSYIQQNS